jgi:vancomycin permeability regulator SanA
MHGALDVRYRLIQASMRESLYQARTPAKGAIIFGAGLRRDGTPTAMLRDRVLTGAELYFSGKVDKLLMSGDNRFVDYNEPEAMRQFALSVGVPAEAIVLDYAGRRTYDTCYRAKLSSGWRVPCWHQGFHLLRPVHHNGRWTLGVEAITVAGMDHFCVGCPEQLRPSRHWTFT